MKRFFIIAAIASLAAFTSFAPIAWGETPDELRARAKAATVKVISEKDRESGSGAVIAQANAHTYVLTAEHIAPTAKSVEVKVTGGKSFAAEVLARSAENDLAVLRIPTTEGLPTALKLAATGAKPKRAMSVGWEKGDAPSSLDESLKGKVRLKKPGETNSVLCWEIERKPAAGRSGGPLVDETGLVLGVASGHDGTSGYYVHIDTIHAFLRLNGLKWLTEE